MSTRSFQWLRLHLVESLRRTAGCLIRDRQYSAGARDGTFHAVPISEMRCALKLVSFARHSRETDDGVAPIESKPNNFQGWLVFVRAHVSDESLGSACSGILRARIVHGARLTQEISRVRKSQSRVVEEASAEVRLRGVRFCKQVNGRGAVGGEHRPSPAAEGIVARG